MRSFAFGLGTRLGKQVPVHKIWRRFYNSNKINIKKTQIAKTSRIKWLGGLLGATAGLTLAFYAGASSESKPPEKLPFPDDVGKFKEGLPTYTSAELRKHNNKKEGIWVSFRDGVYDITEFVETHPGGEKILLAAGSAIDPFWNIYQVHKTGETAELLEFYRIGNIIKDAGQKEIDLSDPYASDPPRHPALKMNTQKPFNAETPIELITDHYITPNDLFFVRNHLPVPQVDPEKYRLVISGEGLETVELTLDDIKTKFPSHTVVASIQCAGNRRSEMSEVKNVRGLSWGSGAISNAEWKGPRLRDVLLSVGLSPSVNVEHIQFEGLDRDFEKFYGASVPAHTVLRPDSEVILAYEMNGETLPVDHGFPVRVVVPGTVGARNVKWVCKIIASSQESLSHWQQKDYKGFGPYTDWDNLDYTKVPAIQELPIQSSITTPKPGTVRLDDGRLHAKGYAWSGGGRGIVRVDVSRDNGETWEEARMVPNHQPLHRAWAWTLWEHTFEIPEGVEEADLVVKAVDASYNVQPEMWSPVWNVRGVLSTAWHRVKVKVEKEEL